MQASSECSIEQGIAVKECLIDKDCVPYCNVRAVSRGSANLHQLCGSTANAEEVVDPVLLAPTVVLTPVVLTPVLLAPVLLPAVVVPVDVVMPPVDVVLPPVVAAADVTPPSCPPGTRNFLYLSSAELQACTLKERMWLAALLLEARQLLSTTQQRSEWPESVMVWSDE